MTVPHPLSVTVNREGARTEVGAAGEIDLLTVGTLQQPLDAAVTAGDDIVLDLRAVEFMDSTGLRVLLETRGRVERSGVGSLRLVIGGNDAVRRLLDLTGVLELFELG